MSLLTAVSALLTGSPAPNICNLDTIYQPGAYEYSLPRQILTSFLDGKAFDHRESYSPEERVALEKDIYTIYQRITTNHPLKEKTIVITAGSPGAGKTVLMEQELKGKNIAYIDPDAVCLKTMEETYQKELRQALQCLVGQAFASEEEKVAAERDVRQQLYNKWRPGSNAANHLILANLIKEGSAIYFGSTSTSPQTKTFLAFLKDQGYHITLLHISAKDDVRWDSIVERDKNFVQTTKQDTQEKGLLFPQRLKDTYLEYADEIKFYLRSGKSENAKLAATWADRKLEVLDPVMYQEIQVIHNEICSRLQGKDLFWPQSLNP